MHTQNKKARMVSNISNNPNPPMNTIPAIPDETKGRCPVKLDSSFESVDMESGIPLQSWSSSVGPGKTNNLPPLYRPGDPVMDDYMRPIPKRPSGELPVRPSPAWYKQRWICLMLFIVGMICIILPVVVAAKHAYDPLPTPVGTISTSSTTTVTKQIPATVVTYIITESVIIPIFSQSTVGSTINQSQGFPPLTTLTTRVTSTDLRNTVVPIPVPPDPPSTSTTTLLTTDISTVIANPPPTDKRVGVVRKIIVGGHVYTTVTETITHSIMTTQTSGRWITKTRASQNVESAPAMSPALNTIVFSRRGLLDWDWRVTSTLTKTIHITVMVTISKTMRNIVCTATDSLIPVPDPRSRTSRRKPLPPNVIDLASCQIAYNGKPTSNERCHGICSGGYCYAYWNVIPCDQWSCCEACGCYNNTLTPPIAANTSTRGMLDCRLAASLNMTKDNDSVLALSQG